MYKQKSLITGYPRVISEKLLFNEGHKVAFLSPNLNFLPWFSIFVRNQYQMYELHSGEPVFSGRGFYICWVVSIKRLHTTNQRLRLRGRYIHCKVFTAIGSIDITYTRCGIESLGMGMSWSWRLATCCLFVLYYDLPPSSFTIVWFQRQAKFFYSNLTKVWIYECWLWFFEKFMATLSLTSQAADFFLSFVSPSTFFFLFDSAGFKPRSRSPWKDLSFR